MLGKEALGRARRGKKRGLGHRIGPGIPGKAGLVVPV